MNIFNLISEPSALLTSLHAPSTLAARRLLVAAMMSCCLLLALTPLRALAAPAQRSHLVKKKVHKVSSQKKKSVPKAKTKAKAKPKAAVKSKAKAKPKAAVKSKTKAKPKATVKPKVKMSLTAQRGHQVKKKTYQASSKKKAPAPTAKLSLAARQRAQNRELLKHHPAKVVTTNYGNKPLKTASTSSIHSSAAERRANRKLIAQHPDWFSHRQNIAPAALNSDSIALAYRDHLQKTTQKAMSTLMKQLGKPYVWGGTSPRVGFDCSGLVYFAYHGLLTEGMPRTANGMYRRARGKKIAQNQLKRGDLIFFHIHTRQDADHVGVYLGNGKFIESPRTGEEIRISTLNKPFWQDHYLGAKRVLTPETII